MLESWHRSRVRNRGRGRNRNHVGVQVRNPVRTIAHSQRHGRGPGGVHTPGLTLVQDITGRAATCNSSYYEISESALRDPCRYLPHVGDLSPGQLDSIGRRQVAIAGGTNPSLVRSDF